MNLNLALFSFCLKLNVLLDACVYAEMIANVEPTSVEPHIGSVSDNDFPYEQIIAS